MISKSFSAVRIFFPALLFLAISGEALAQGSFRGEWIIVDVHSPDWAGNPAAVKPAPGPGFEGGTVDFRSSEVVANGALACRSAVYQILNVRLNEIFQGRAGTYAENAAESAGISDNSKTLRVTCGNGESVDYHEAGKSLVVLSGDYLYTLMREDLR